MPCSVRYFRAVAVGALVVLAAPADAFAQQKDDKPAVPALDFSGLLLANFRDAHDSLSHALNGGHDANKFDIERVYLTFKMPTGDRGSVRVTTDVFNRGPSGTNNYYDGWTVRLKYAYFQYNFLQDIGGHKGFNFSARAGMLNSAVIDHEETFWPRYMSQTAVERSGFFSSSDIGLSGVVSLPGKWGEVFAEVADGNGYGTSETDPYKDYSARVSLTPFGTRMGIIKTLTISPYVYHGRTSSAFISAAAAGHDVTDGLKRNRTGVFAGVKSHALTLGAEWGRRTETVESGATLAQRSAFDNSGTLKSGFAIIRPVELFSPNQSRKSPFGLLVRVDNFHPYSDPRAAAAAGGIQTTASANQLVITSVFWDLASNATFSIDEQDYSPLHGSRSTPSRVLFAHMQVAF